MIGMIGIMGFARAAAVGATTPAAAETSCAKMR
jgi:hypothetical protein